MVVNLTPLDVLWHWNYRGWETEKFNKLLGQNF